MKVKQIKLRNSISEEFISPRRSKSEYEALGGIPSELAQGEKAFQVGKIKEPTVVEEVVVEVEKPKRKRTKKKKDSE